MFILIHKLRIKYVKLPIDKKIHYYLLTFKIIFLTFNSYKYMYIHTIFILN